MKKSLKSLLMATALVSTPAMADQVAAGIDDTNVFRVGVIDTKLTGFVKTKFPDVKVNYQEPPVKNYYPAQWEVRANKISHGDLMVSGVIQGIKDTHGEDAKIEIFYVNPYLRSARNYNSKDSKSIIMNWKAAYDGIDWMKANDVKIIGFMGNSTKSKYTDMMVKKINENNMIMMTSIGNDKLKELPAPASYAKDNNIISVVGNAKLAVAANNKGNDVDFAFNARPQIYKLGAVQGNIKNATSSSFATAYSAGVTAVVESKMGNSISVDGIKNFYKGLAEPYSYRKLQSQYVDADAVKVKLGNVVKVASRAGATDAPERDLPASSILAPAQRPGM